MRECILAILVLGCGDASVKVDPDLSIAGDLSVGPDMTEVKPGCLQLVQCVTGCSGVNARICADLCLNEASASGKALLQALLDCWADACTTQTFDAGAPPCTAAEGQILSDPAADHTSVSNACNNCATVVLGVGGICKPKVDACSADKS